MDQRDLKSFLQAKRRLDLMACHSPTRDRLRSEIGAMPQDQPLRLLEPGCGIGSMLVNLFGMEELRHAQIDAYDVDDELINAARANVADVAPVHGFTVAEESDRWHLRSENRHLELHLFTADLYDVITSQERKGQYDLVITHALLDLFPIPRILPDLLGLLKPGGLFYAPITFDGGTAFDPAVEVQLDRNIIDLYHASMMRFDEKGVPFDGSKAGSALLQELEALGAEILSKGDSNWVVHPDLKIEEEEHQIFLHTLLDYVEREVGNSQEMDRATFDHWLNVRRSQVEQNRLLFFAHNIDVLARV